jgi:hypothetical protein
MFCTQSNAGLDATAALSSVLGNQRAPPASNTTLWPLQQATAGVPLNLDPCLDGLCEVMLVSVGTWAV